MPILPWPTSAKPVFYPVPKHAQDAEAKCTNGRRARTAFLELILDTALIDLSGSIGMAKLKLLQSKKKKKTTGSGCPRVKACLKHSLEKDRCAFQETN